MRIFEQGGIRSWRRNAESLEAARAIAAEVRRLASAGVADPFLSDVVATLRAARVLGLDQCKAAAAYQVVARALPFEAEGRVYRIEGERQEGKPLYERVKRIVSAPGRLEDVPPTRRPGDSLDRRIEDKLGELTPLANVYAMREEARKLVDAKLGAVEIEMAQLRERIADLEKSALS